MLKNKERLLMPLALALTLLASGCTTTRVSSLPPSVAPARIPPLSPEARQPLAPQWCYPTCSGGLMIERENWRKLMTKPE